LKALGGVRDLPSQMAPKKETNGGVRARHPARVAIRGIKQF
jgi:hypothetical protein